MTVPAPRAACLALFALALLTLPAAAQGKTKTVDMGLPAKAVNEFQQKYGSDVNAFFPKTVTVRAGDKVKFRPVGFHTADFPPTGGDPLPLLAPTGQKVAGVNDANGVPFWFNGQDQAAFNPELLASAFGKKRTYNGSKRVDSGLPLAQKPKPMTVKFTKKGTYRYFCDVHPGMIGKVVVKRKGAKVPNAKQDKARVRKQLSQARKRAKSLAGTVPPANTIYTGGSAPGGVEYFGMLPATTTVKAGTQVKFMMSPDSFDVHTASFGPGNPETEPNSYLGQIAATFAGAPVIDPRGVYPSEMPPSIASYSSTLHGNGFWNSGAMDNGAATPLASSNNLTFNTPGTYDFYCLIHPFMHGQVVVQP